VSQEVSGLLSKAERSIAAAGMLLRTGDTDFAASRAYYAMSYAAEALLLSRGLSFNKHTGVHAAFGKHFTKSGEFHAKYHRWLLEAFAARIAGDYGADVVLENAEVEETIQRAHAYLRATREYLHGPLDMD
jgi:uncharacterized protein (UPF0332 family)